MTDATRLMFRIKGPYKHGDGSMRFTMIVDETSPVVGGVSEIRAIAEVQIDDVTSLLALAEAMRQAASKMPPDLTVMQ